MASTSGSSFSSSLHGMKCLCPGHFSRPIEYICLDKTCCCDSRLACVKCQQGFHSEHAHHLAKINDLFTSSELSSSSPIVCADETSKSISEFLANQQSLQTDLLTEIDIFILSFKEKVLERLEKVRTKLINDVKSFGLRGEGVEKYADQRVLEKHYALGFDESDIREIIRRLLVRDISPDTFHA